jgi:hypothetical protein
VDREANKRVQFGHGLNYMVDVDHAVIVDVEATPARPYDEVAAARVMIERTEQRLNLNSHRLIADTAYGTGKQRGCPAARQRLPMFRVSQYQRDDKYPDLPRSRLGDLRLGSVAPARHKLVLPR